MKLVYLAQIGLFDDYAHTVQIMKMCEAFAQSGVEVELVVPNRRVSNNSSNPLKDNPFEYNNVKNNFKITKLPFIDLFYSNPSSLLYKIRLISFFLSSRVYLMFQNYNLLYTRDIYLLPTFGETVLELHSFPKNLSELKLYKLNKVKTVVVLTSFIKSKLINIGVDENKIVVSPDAVRLEDFSSDISKSESRKKLSISMDDFIFGYVGTLKTMNQEKGVKTAIESLSFLSTKYKLYVVGGEESHINEYKDMATRLSLTNRVIFAGQVPHKTIPFHMAVCDALVAPFPQSEHYNYYMSPLKIFEYMASKRPIVTTTLPSIMEILSDDENAVLVPPSSPHFLAKAIEKLSADPEFSSRISQKAYDEVVNKYTWKIRAQKIINIFKNENYR